MTSNPPGECCATGIKHNGTPVGSMEVLNGIETYVVGNRSSDKVMLFLTDIFGPKFINSQLLADGYARHGFLVIMPDILFGDYATGNAENMDFAKFRREHTVEATEPIIHKTHDWIKANTKATYITTIGFCFGGKYAVRLLGDGRADAASIFHPSLISKEELASIKGPLLINAAEEDPIFPTELRHKSELMLADMGARYAITVYSGTVHGFACRADPKDAVAFVAMEKAFGDTCWWFHTVRK